MRALSPLRKKKHSRHWQRLVATFPSAVLCRITKEKWVEIASLRLCLFCFRNGFKKSKSVSLVWVVEKGQLFGDSAEEIT